MYDGFINIAKLKERFKTKPLTECYGIKIKEVDGYRMIIPIDGKNLVLSTWRSDIQKVFRRSDSLIKEAEGLGFTAIHFGSAMDKQLTN